jgi:hypothetical protein
MRGPSAAIASTSLLLRPALPWSSGAFGSITHGSYPGLGEAAFVACRLLVPKPPARPRSHATTTSRRVSVPEVPTTLEHGSTAESGREEAVEGGDVVPHVVRAAVLVDLQRRAEPALVSDNEVRVAGDTDGLAFFPALADCGQGRRSSDRSRDRRAGPRERPGRKDRCVGRTLRISLRG